MEYPAYLQQHLKANSPGQTISLDLSLSKVPIGALVFIVVSRAYRTRGVMPPVLGAKPGHRMEVLPR